MASPRVLLRYAEGRLGLRRYLKNPGDGRPQPRIAARVLLWAMLIGRLLRETSFAGVEQLVRSGSRRALAVPRAFSDDVLEYFSERLDAGVTRAALAQLVRRAKRNKAFQNSRFIGLALDGTTAGRSQQSHCQWCRPIRNHEKELLGYHHQLAVISVVGTGLTLPFDAEPYGPGDSEYSASTRLLLRAVGQLGARFADYVVVDGEYARAPFLHTVGDAGLYVVARLKQNLPELYQAVQQRFASQPPAHVYQDGRDRVEIWDADDFDPWDTLKWETVRVIRYRQHKPDGSKVEAEWLTDFPSAWVGSLSLYRMGKSRWEIENQAFNDAKNRYGMEHICHHETNSVLIVWLLILLTLTIERLFRVRYLHRGTHPVSSAEQLCLRLWLSLSRSPQCDTG